jgi:NADH-quinone oxidoreductase subunit A
MIDPYIAILIMFVVSVAIALGLIGLTSYLGPKVLNKVKLEPFECGSESLTPSRRRMSVKFYLVAALFIMFDIEVVFLYPWAVHYRELGMFGFVAAAIFLFILTAGLVYEWKKGALEWT